MYTYGNGQDKHCYDVYLRIHATTGTGHWNSLPSVSAWTLDGFLLTSTDDETSLVVYKDENTVTNYWDTGDACWCKIGVLKGEPSIVTSEGEKIALATCNDKVVGKKVDVDFTSLEVTKENWEEMLDLEDDYNVDCLFVETGNVTASTTGNGWGVANMQLDVNLMIKGNTVNEMPFKMSKEVGNIRKFVNCLDVQL